MSSPEGNQLGDQWSDFGTPLNFTIPAPLADGLRTALFEYVNNRGQTQGPHGRARGRAYGHGRGFNQNQPGMESFMPMLMGLVGPMMASMAAPRQQNQRGFHQHHPHGRRNMKHTNRGQTCGRKGSREGRQATAKRGGGKNKGKRGMNKTTTKEKKFNLGNDMELEVTMTQREFVKDQGENSDAVPGVEKAKDTPVLDQVEAEVEQQIQNQGAANVTPATNDAVPPSNPPVPRQNTLGRAVNQQAPPDLVQLARPFLDVGMQVLGEILDAASDSNRNPRQQPNTPATPTQPPQ